MAQVDDRVAKPRSPDLSLVWFKRKVTARQLIALGVSYCGALRLTGLATTVACVLCTFAPVPMVMMAIERIDAMLAAQTGMVGPLVGIWLLAKWR